jgi:TPP-dependent pyruvate/acetoin dehydrogenase alpha subunit
MNFSAETIKSLYKDMQLIRRAEQVMAEIYPTDKIKSPMHLSVGQESISVGVCSALRPEDAVAGTYRGHAMYLAKQGGLKEMIAELYGKKTGCSGGKGGSMHLIAPEQNILGTSAVVGTTIPIAVGYAMALKRKKLNQVVVVFMGDGATEEGVFYESVNFAALHKLPIIFVCENNGFAIYTEIKKRWAAPTICERVAGFGLPTKRFETSDVLAIREHMDHVLPLMRSGELGPIFIESLTYRWLDHVGPGEDFHLQHRSKADLEKWKEHDQVIRLGKMIDPATKEKIDSEIEQQIKEAVLFAEESPFPADEELYEHVYSK